MDYRMPGKLAQLLPLASAILIGAYLRAAPEAVTPPPRIIVEALIDGPSELRVTKSGLYWINIANAKPGRHEQKDEPTYIDDQPWKPVWNKPAAARGPDTSDTRPLALDPDRLQFELLAVGDSHGSTGIQKRSAITVKRIGEELSILVPDPERGSRWYRFALVRATAPPPFPLVLDPDSKSVPPPPAAPGPARLATPPPAPIDVATFVKANRQNIVSFKTPSGEGGGFIVRLNGHVYFVTNTRAAVAARGAVFQAAGGGPGPATLAVGHDLFRMAILNPTDQPLEAMERGSMTAVGGDAILVLGAADGPSEANPIPGKIVGLRPNLVEIDAPFPPGQSGCPIIHLKTGKVIGVATFLTIREYDPTIKAPVKDPVVRRYGVRLDSATIWQPLKAETFLAQAAEMEAIEKLTEDLAAFVTDLADDGSVTRYLHTNAALRNRVDAWLDAKAKRLSPQDAVTNDQALLAFLKTASQADLAAARQRSPYDYFQRVLGEQEKERTTLTGILEKLLKSP